MTELEFTNALLYIENNRPAIVAALFPEAEPYYRDEWFRRDTVGFWAHLDLGNRRRVLGMAAEHCT